MDSQFTVVGLGELLWDLLPSGKQLGGAPANFAYCSHLLGNRGVVASRVGADALGREAREQLLARALTDRFLQADSSLPTGTVEVQLDNGQPRYQIATPCAWDAFEWTLEWETLAHSTHAVCFGTLAQRAPASQSAITRFLRAVPASATRVFDINLRQSFYSPEIIAACMRPGMIVKISEEELPTVAGLLNLPLNPADFCRQAFNQFDLRLICVTRGANGSILFDLAGADEHPGFQVQVKDAVGAGDAFTAGLVHEFLRGSSLSMINDTANRMGAWVASQSGAMPEPPQGLNAAFAALQLNC